MRGPLGVLTTVVSESLHGPYGLSASPVHSPIVCAIRDGKGPPFQYWNGGPLPSLIAQTIGEWTGDALSPYGPWSDSDTTVVSTPNGPRMPFNTSGINLRYANMLGVTQPTTHFVI